MATTPAAQPVHVITANNTSTKRPCQGITEMGNLSDVHALSCHLMKHYIQSMPTTPNSSLTRDEDDLAAYSLM